MANTQSGSVIFVDTTAYTGVGKAYICAIKYIGASSGTATIKDGGANGNVVWEELGASNIFNQVEMTITDLYVTLANSAKVYIYLRGE